MSTEYNFTPSDVIARFIQDEAFRKELIALFAVITTLDNSASQSSGGKR